MTDDLAEVAAALRAVLVQIEDPDSELGASPAMRNRIEGAAVTLESLARTSENDRICDDS